MRLGPDGEPIRFDMLVDATRFPAWVNVLELVDLYWDEVGIDMNVSGISGELLLERGQGNAYDAMGGFSDGGLALLLNPGLIMPAGGSNFAPAWGAWYDLGTFGAEPQEPPDIVKQQQDLYDQVKATADPDVQRELMNQIIDIAADQFYRIGISLDMGQYGVVKNNYHNTSTYWIEQ